MTMHVTATSDVPGDGSAAVLIMLARVEGKLDVLAAQHSTKLDEHARRLDDVEGRLRTREAAPDVPAAVDDRLRAVEQRPTVSPGAALAGAAAVAAILAAATPFLDRLYS
ncbi:hypothetical protein ACPXB5_11345 [Micromonospora arida]|uniref:hypothetical protein n=1 Tax=Micromonospora arida TaxID=2203715 RepID=UPI003CFA9C0C